MVTIDRRANRKVRPRVRHRPPAGVRIATIDEGIALFDHQARSLLGISGEVFLRRWDAGAYEGLSDEGEDRKVLRLAMLIPFARRTLG